MTQLIFLIAFISAEKCKFIQTLNVGINSPTTKDAYTGMTKYLLLRLLAYGNYARDKSGSQNRGVLSVFSVTVQNATTENRGNPSILCL